MKESRRTRRMALHHKRRKDRTASLNMVSLMDIFTILVFFLLVTSSESDVLPSAKAVKLPASTTEQQPKKTLVVLVTQTDIQINGKHVIDIEQTNQSDSAVIPQLARELLLQAKQETSEKKRFDVTIMGDKEIPYKLLKKIMMTCAGTKYANISLAVVQKAPEKS